MSTLGNYLYGFTDSRFQPAPQLRGLAGAPVRIIGCGEVAAVVSHHPVQRLRPSRANLEPHHRVVRQISSEATLVPAAFGHISETRDGILDVLRGNYDDIREELARLDSRSEMNLKLTWNVGNIFEHLVRTSRGLREARDRVFRGRHPSVADKLDVGALFEATLAQERERLSELLLAALRRLTHDTVSTPPRDERTVCQVALLIQRSREAEFLTVLRGAAACFDTNFTLEYSGPWPAYSFVRLRLRTSSLTPSS